MATLHKKTETNQKREPKKIIETELRKGKASEIDNTHYERYRITLTFGKIKMSNNKIVEPMLHVANFLHKWLTIDKHAKLAVINGEFKTNFTTSHTYNIQDLPTNPTEIIHPPRVLHQKWQRGPCPQHHNRNHIQKLILVHNQTNCGHQLLHQIKIK
jgi:hypothetical protein